MQGYQRARNLYLVAQHFYIHASPELLIVLACFNLLYELREEYQVNVNHTM